jgi:hypothetical protein
MKKILKILILFILIAIVTYIVFIKFINNKIVSLPCHQDRNCPIGTMCVDMGKTNGGYLCVSDGECSLCPSGKCEVLEKYPPGIHCIGSTDEEFNSEDFKCSVDSDCSLDACSGARTKKYWDAHPIRNACIRYENHHAACIDGMCKEVLN